jgi:hypothetical protein
MPRIPEDLARSVAFLYPSRAAAEDNVKRGGTCFLMGKPVEGYSDSNGGTSYFIYAVTNFHVAWSAGASVLRLNRRDGRKHILDLASSDWVPHPDGDDLAVAFLSGRLGGLDSVDRAIDHLRFVETDRLLTEETMRRCSIGVGDDVFMIGRFLNHQGTKDTITPAVRFGSISVMPEPIWNTTINADQLSFAVEMRSRTGFSGSPVAAYRTPLNRIFNVPAEQHEFLWVIGVNWGHILEKDTGENTWLNGVIPAWKILELLEVPALRDNHDKATDDLKKWRDSLSDGHAVPAAASAEEVSPAGAVEPNHRDRAQEG